MTYSTLASQVNLDAGGNRMLPARSIPNLPIDTSTHSITASSTDAYHLARCSSQPPEMWGRHILDGSGGFTSKEDGEHLSLNDTTNTINNPPVDIRQFEAFVLANPRHVLNLLGIEPAYHPVVTYTDVLTTGQAATATFPNNNWNGSNRNAESCRSTDALLSGHQSDDGGQQLAPNETINFSIVKEGSFKRNRSIDPAGSSGKSSSSNLWSPPAVASPVNTTVRNRFTVSTVPSARTSTGSSKRSSWIESNKLYKMMNDQNDGDDEAPPPSASTTTIAPLSDGNAGHRMAARNEPDMDELSEKCALLYSDVRRGSSRSSATADVFKRHLLAPSRTPVNYRFSAGDADKLEKGIKTMPSSRSLKEK